jgi:hypothetical protein
MSPDEHLTCAAMISAADLLIVSGEVAVDALILDQGLVASMTHLNNWSIPNDVHESEAFERVFKERDRLMAELSPTEIVARARLCIAAI